MSATYEYDRLKAHGPTEVLNVLRRAGAQGWRALGPPESHGGTWVVWVERVTPVWVDFDQVGGPPA